MAEQTGDDTPPRPKRGRPTSFTPLFEKKFLAMVAKGVFPETAARANGVSGRTYYEWMQLGKEQAQGPMRDFRSKVITARAQAQASHVEALMKASKRGNIKATMFYLERTDPAHWGRKDRLDIASAVRPDDLLLLMREMAGVVQDNVTDPKVLLRIQSGWMAILAKNYPEAVADAQGGINAPPSLPPGGEPVEDRAEESSEV